MKKLKIWSVIGKVVLAVVLVALIAGVIALAWNTTTWFDWAKPDVQVEDIEEDKADIDNPLSVNYSNNDRLFLETIQAPVAVADNTVTISATVKNTECIASPGLQTVQFSLAWKTDNSDDVKKYIKLTVDGTVATVECLQPFSVPILLVCSSTIVPSVTASAELGYRKRLETVTYKYFDNEWTMGPESCISLNLPVEGSLVSTAEWQTEKFFPIFKTKYGTGTTLNAVIRSFSITATESFRSVLTRVSGNTVSSFGSLSYGGFDDTYSGGYSLYSLVNQCAGCNAFVPSYYSYFYDAVKSVAGDHQFEVKCTIEGVGVKEYFTYYLSFIVPEPNVSSVELDSNSFIF